MHVLVTGSAGFIGFHTVNALLDRGHTVAGVDNFNAYYSAKLKRDRSARLRSRPGFTEHEGDCADAGFMAKLVESCRFDAVCHLAAQPGVRYSLTHPFVSARANIDGFLAVVEACRRGGVRRLVYASSSSVYGKSTELPFSESDRADGPISLYAATKRANELIAHVYTHLHGIQTVGLRFFTVYGPWGRPDMAVWQFTEAMLAGRAIPLFNSGQMQRDFTFVADVAPAVYAALAAGNLAPCDILNIGNHRPEPVMDVVRAIASALGVEPKIDMLPMQPGDLVSTCADNDRARALLGFTPSTSIQSGIPQFVRWYREYHGV